MVTLSNEQNMMIDYALKGHNILVDACIGSGKTTSIQQLCNLVPTSKRILYLTYNKLLKQDAKSKIHRKNSIITNYHGFAYMCLSRMGIRAGISDLIQTFNKVSPNVAGYDIVIIDEYQDIEQELAIMLLHIKESNPGIQIIMVGDMAQKIYDKTALDVESFVEDYLGDHIKLEYTNCFRISEEHAAMLGRIWNKEIRGVNKNCEICEMTEHDAGAFIAECDPSEVLCLGARTGSMSRVLNELEEEYPLKYNKNTVYASISDQDARMEPGPSTAIFTTFDSSKGLERKYCFVFDFTQSYWSVRISQPDVKYEILRNIFCVAASRGKDKIVFVRDKSGEAMLTEKILSTNVKNDNNYRDMDISSMFDFKYIEDVEECYGLLEIKEIQAKDRMPIDVECHDGMIDLSPCIGIFQEACFFKNYDMMDEFDLFYKTNPDRNKINRGYIQKLPLEKQILLLVSLQTNQNRYRNQAKYPFVTKFEENLIQTRLSHYFSEYDQSQVPCYYGFESEDGKKTFGIMGYADVVRDDTVYELKFVQELQHTHFLQCAMYMFSLRLKKGRLLNVRTNEMFEIKIRDESKFISAVIKTVTKHRYMLTL